MPTCKTSYIQCSFENKKNAWYKIYKLKMNSFCGVMSDKPAKKSNCSPNCVCDFQFFVDLERDIKTLYEEMISLETDFKLESEAIQQWQYQVDENILQVTLIKPVINDLQRSLSETEFSLRIVTRELENLDLNLKPIESVTDKIAFNSDSQEYKLYSLYLKCFNDIESMRSALLNREDFVKFVKIDNITQIILCQVDILENIENEISSLQELQEINNEILKCIEQVCLNDCNKKNQSS